MSETYKGSCLCRAVQFEIQGAFDSFYLCHCTHCRKDTGSAHAANLFAHNATINWVSGQEKCSIFTMPSTRHSKGFCKNCGSALPVTQMEGQLLVVPAGCLDSEVEIKPTAHIFCESKAGWDTGFHDTPRFERLPN